MSLGSQRVWGHFGVRLWTLWWKAAVVSTQRTLGLCQLLCVGVSFLKAAGLDTGVGAQ